MNFKQMRLLALYGLNDEENTQRECKIKTLDEETTQLWIKLDRLREIRIKRSNFEPVNF